MDLSSFSSSTLPNEISLLCKSLFRNLTQNQPILSQLLELNDLLCKSSTPYSVHSILFPLFFIHNQKKTKPSSFNLKENEIQAMFILIYNSITIYSQELLQNQNHIFEHYFLWIFEYINTYSDHQYSDEVYMIILYTYIHLLQLFIPDYRCIPHLLSFISEIHGFIYMNEDSMDSSSESFSIQGDIDISLIIPYPDQHSFIPIINIQNYLIQGLDTELIRKNEESIKLYQSEAFHKYISIILSIFIEITHSSSPNLSIYSSYSIDMMILLGDSSFITVIYPLTLSTFSIYIQQDSTIRLKKRILSLFVFYHLLYKRIEIYIQQEKIQPYSESKSSNLWNSYQKEIQSQNSTSSSQNSKESIDLFEQTPKYLKQILSIFPLFQNIHFQKSYIYLFSFILPSLYLYKDLLNQHIDLLVSLISHSQLSDLSNTVLSHYFNQYYIQNQILHSYSESNISIPLYYQYEWNQFLSNSITNRYLDFYKNLVHSLYLHSNIDYFLELIYNYYILCYKDLVFIYNENIQMIFQYFKSIVSISSIQTPLILSRTISLMIQDDFIQESEDSTLVQSMKQYYNRMNQYLTIQFTSINLQQFYIILQLVHSLSNTTSIEIYLNYLIEELKTGSCDLSIPFLLLEFIRGSSSSESIINDIIDLYTYIFQSIQIENQNLLCILIYTYSYYLSYNKEYTIQLLPNIIYILYEYRGSSNDLLSISSTLCIQQLSKILGYISIYEFTVSNLDYIFNTSLLYLNDIHLHLTTPILLYYIWNDLNQESKQLQELVHKIPNFMVYLQDILEIYFDILSRNNRDLNLISSILHSLYPLLNILFTLYDGTGVNTSKTLDDCIEFFHKSEEDLDSNDDTKIHKYKSKQQYQCKNCHKFFSIYNPLNPSDKNIYCEDCLFHFHSIHFHYNKFLSLLYTNLYIYNGKQISNESIEEELNEYKESKSPSNVYEAFSNKSTDQPSSLILSIFINITNNIRFYLHSQNLYCQQYSLSILLSILIHIAPLKINRIDRNQILQIMNKIYPLLVPLFKQMNMTLFIPIYKLILLCVHINSSTYKHKYIEDIWPVLKQILILLYKEIKLNRYELCINDQMALDIYTTILEGIYKYDYQYLYSGIENQLLELLFSFLLIKEQNQRIYDLTYKAITHLYIYYPDSIYEYIYKHHITIDSGLERVDLCIDQYKHQEDEESSSKNEYQVSLESNQQLSSILSNLLHNV